ncbi:Hypothetical protein Asd1617_00394 [Shigella dysenteriae 1617]|uniref:Uncharacterized protein n=2 Tax=Shigella dysenteriae TaxID=622 RepID=A0A0A6ZNP2_SHIDY|nr:Hypothetical protein Asd1617_00394 [Shigella dysenteriae 1617]
MAVTAAKSVMAFRVLTMAVDLCRLTTRTMNVNAGHERTSKARIIHQIQLIRGITPKNDYLKKVPLTAQLIAKYKMDDQLDQLLVPREIQDEIKSKIRDKIDELSKNLFNTMTETIENNFDDIFRQQSENMSNYYEFVD